MKKLIFSLSLLLSVAASASEIKVLDIDAKTAGRGSLTTRFEVNLQDDSAGVSVRITKKNGGKNPYTTSRTFEKTVPELALNEKNLELTVDGKTVVCGTMGVTNVFNRPVLRLSGKCDVVATRVAGRVVVSVVAE
jgi:hypothetical protein